MLESMIADPTPDDSDARRLARIAAFSIWSLGAPDDPADQVEILDLPAKEVHALVDDAYARILGMSQSDADLARIAGEQLLNAPPDQRGTFFEETERLRRRSNAQAGRVYAPLLADPRYRDIWPLLAEGILADNHPGDAWLLEQCARCIDDPDAADTLRKTAMTLRTRNAGVTELVRVPIETVAGLVQEVIRTADFEGTTLPADLVETAHRFMRLPYADRPDVEPDSCPDSVNEGDLADLLSHPLFDGWIFGLSEIYAADL